jgi:uncharacterized protein YqgV (UPF0045/DUF77 family)
MTSKNQLQSKIQELEAELQEFKQQLGSYKETPTIQEASVGDVLEDGSIVLQKSNGLALLVAPSSTEVEATWSKDFAEVFQKLKEQGFNPSQWFVPTKEQLRLAYKTILDEFSSACYWSSTELDATGACIQYFCDGFFTCTFKTSTSRVRAFRCVTY